MVKHYNITVSGKVQGVFYRASTKRMAEELGIAGFVRNEPNGAVYIEAEGTTDQLAQLIDWCKVGPTSARVENVHYTPGEIVNFSDFEVRR